MGTHSLKKTRKEVKFHVHVTSVSRVQQGLESEAVIEPPSQHLERIDVTTFQNKGECHSHMQLMMEIQADLGLHERHHHSFYRKREGEKERVDAMPQCWDHLSFITLSYLKNSEALSSQACHMIPKLPKCHFGFLLLYSEEWVPE